MFGKFLDNKLINQEKWGTPKYGVLDKVYTNTKTTMYYNFKQHSDKEFEMEEFDVHKSICQ